LATGPKRLRSGVPVRWSGIYGGGRPGSTELCIFFSVDVENPEKRWLLRGEWPLQPLHWPPRNAESPPFVEPNPHHPL